VHETAAVVLAGGTVFKTLPAETGRHPLSLLRNTLALSAYARARGRQLLAVGVGVGRLETSTSRLLARKVAAQCELLVLRDSSSAHLLATAGVPAPMRVGADPAWTLLDQVPRPASPSNRVVVVPSRWAVADAPHHLRALAAALRPLPAAGFSVQIQPWQVGGSPGPDDRDHSAWLFDQLSPDAELLPPPHDIPDAVRSFHGARLVVAARFHAALAAAAAGATALTVANEPKHTSLAARLDQPSVSAWATPAELAAALSGALEAAPPTAAAVRAEIAAADEAFGLLRLMVADGEQPVESISGLRLEPVW